jgi:pectate lyase
VAILTKLACAAVIALGCAVAMTQSGLPAFPGAEGFGSTAPGGRGGKIYEVTSLDDHGPGSLREAVEAAGPRIVVFRVSGTIPLEKDLEIENSNITIAGQTAPGDGICLKNYKLGIASQNVVVRYLRIRRGQESKLQDDGLGIYAGKDGDAENVIVDHCTISWTCDEAVNTWHGTKNATIQWCIISEALHNAVHAGHGFAATLGGVNTTYHHNLIASCPGRNPSIAGNNDFQTINLDFRNNIIFNWQERVIDGKPSSINFVYNYYKHGPASRFNDHIAKIDTPNYTRIGTPKWYITGNFLVDQPEISADNRKGVIGEVQYLVDKPNEFAPVKTQTPQELYPLVLSGAGASIPRRDPVDLRIVEEVRSGKTHYRDGILQDPSNVGGWPELKSASAPADSDHDGMPDWWEKKYRLNPNDPADGVKDINGDGYTNIEKYLNGLDPKKKIDWTRPENNRNRLTETSLRPS